MKSLLALFALLILLPGSTLGQLTLPLRVECPPDRTNWTCGVESTLRVTYPVPEATGGNCTTRTTLTCSPPSGGIFILGTTTVTCIATNSCGQSDTCRFRVTVARDTVAPVIQCPTNLTVALCTLVPPDARVFWPTPVATDNADTNVTVTCTPPSGSFFPPGNTTVTCTATDDCTNRTTCSFQVRVVRDTTPPTLQCPSNIVITNCEARGVTVNYLPPAATDNLDSAPTVTCVPAPGSLFPVGSTTVTCIAVDSCTNRTECKFTVAVVGDTTPPVIQCPPDITLWTCSTSAVTHYAVTATDNMDPDVAITCDPPVGTPLPVGDTTVQCTATDDCGNTSRCSFRVHVLRDTTPPTIECPSNMVFNCLCPGNTFVLDFFKPTVTDDHDPNPTVVCVPPSLISSPGVHPVVCTATDNCGNSNRCSFTVTFNYDTTPPVITCPTNMNIWTCSNSARVNYSVTATDNCTSSVTPVCTPPSGSLFPVGNTTVTCIATDNCTNRSTCTFTVTVNRDNSPPEILCPSLIQMQCEGIDGTAVQFTATASDECDSNVLVQCVPPSGTIFPRGTNIVTCTATDAAGNESLCTFPVVINGDCTPVPCIEIVCPSNIIVKCDIPGGAVVDFSMQATNVCDSQLTVTCDPPSGSRFQAGLTTVLCTAQSRTNTAWCSFLVEVQDDTPPVIHCPTNLVVASSGEDGTRVSWTATATDDCDTNVIVHCDSPPGSLFAIGTTIVRCIATDSSGNRSLCAFRVTVREARPITISHQSPSDAVVRWHMPGMLEAATTLSPPDWLPIGDSVNTNGDERTLRYRLNGPARFFRVAATDLAPLRDEDGDGVPDELDRCPGTPTGVAVDARGCSLIELATSPEQVAGRSLEMLNELGGYWREYPALSSAGKNLEERVEEMNIALGFIRDGHITSTQEPLGLERFSVAVAGLRGIHDDMLGIVAGRERDLLANPPDTGGYADITHHDAEIMALRFQASRFQRAIAEADSAEDLLLGLRRSRTGQSTLRGQVAEINNAQHWIKFKDGRRVGLAQAQFSGHLAPGAEVELEVQTFADGSALAQSINVLNTGVLHKQTPEVVCLFLRIVPVQPLPPYFSTTPILHHPTAYEHDGKLILEQGMRFAAVNGNCPVALVPPGTLVMTRMKLDLQYKPAGPNASLKTVTLATSLGPDSEPVPFPWDIGSGNAWLTVTVFRQQCPSIGLPGSCADPEVLSVSSYSLFVSPRYIYAKANYQTTVFDLEDSPQEEGYRVTQVTSVTVSSALSSTPFTFKAQGFAVNGDNVAMDYIALNEPFAVHEWDLYDTPSVFFKEQTYGVTNRSALYWPRITGNHNGRPFRYTCGVPNLIRDAVSFCGNSPHTFYRLPFTGGWPTWGLSQGNFGSFSHTGAVAYAFDFSAPAGTQIRAARGGIVEQVVESFSASSYDPTQGICTNFNANFVRIRHQDGTLGGYGHMPQNGVLVPVGKKVRRGEVIAMVGTTGCSAGPHLHFHVDNASGNNSIPSRFERWSSWYNSSSFSFQLSPPLLECDVPTTGTILFSSQ